MTVFTPCVRFDHILQVFTSWQHQPSHRLYNTTQPHNDTNISGHSPQITLLFIPEIPQDPERYHTTTTTRNKAACLLYVTAVLHGAVDLRITYLDGSTWSGQRATVMTRHWTRCWSILLCNSPLPATVV